MKAVVVRGPGILAVEEVDRPRIEADEMLLRVRDCGICGSDVHAAGSMPPGTILGHEFSGEVIEVGRGVSDWSPGDRAVSLPFFSCGDCSLCRAGDGIFCPEIRALGLGQMSGAYAEFVRVQPENCLRVPASLGMREAALVEPLAVGLHGVRRSRLESGDVCLIIGAGPIGLATLIWVNALGAKAVVSEVSPGRRAMAERLGAAAVVDPGVDDPFRVAVDISGGGGPPVIFECVGRTGLIRDAMTMAPLRAQIIVLGVCMEMDQIFPVSGILKELDIGFTLGYSKREFAESLDALSSGRIIAGPMITDVIDLAGVAEMFAMLTAPNSQCKVMIEFA